MFQWLYWHSLLPGRDIPGIGSAMPHGAGKRTGTGQHLTAARGGA